MRWLPFEETDLEKNEWEYYCFPEQESMERVRKTNGGRVFTLYSKLNEERFFFWLQDPDESKDTDFIVRINKEINNTQEETPSK